VRLAISGWRALQLMRESVRRHRRAFRRGPMVHDSLSLVNAATPLVKGVASRPFSTPLAKAPGKGEGPGVKTILYGAAGHR
jgi:hypothetical protein